MDQKVKGKKNVEQTVLFSDFLRLCGSAEKVSIVRDGDLFRLEGKFNLGGGRTMSISTRPVLLRNGATTLLPWR